MRRAGSALLAVMAVMAVFASCTSADPVAVEPEQIAEIDRCEVIGTATIEIIDAYLDALETLTSADVIDPANPVMADLDARGLAVQERAAELDCDQTDIRNRVADHVDGFEPESPAAVEFVRQLWEAYGVEE